jgi:hypothetical protein
MHNLYLYTPEMKEDDAPTLHSSYPTKEAAQAVQQLLLWHGMCLGYQCDESPNFQLEPVEAVKQPEVLRQGLLKAFGRKS